MPRKDKGGDHKVTPKVQSNQCSRFSNGKPLQDWAFEAYTLHVGRGQSVLSLAKQYGVEWRVVRRNIDAAHAAVCEANDSDALPALEKHKARLLEVLKSAYQDYARADNDKRPGFLRIILDTSEKLAAAEGVVTDRKGLDVSGELNVNHDHAGAAVGKLLEILAATPGDAAEGDAGSIPADAESAGA